MYPFKFNFKITTPGSNWSLTPWSKNLIERHQEVRNKHEMTPNNCLPNHLHFSQNHWTPKLMLGIHMTNLAMFFLVPIYFKYPKMANSQIFHSFCWPPMLCPSHRLAEPYSCLPPPGIQGDLLDLHFYIFFVVSWWVLRCTIRNKCFWIFLREVGQAILGDSMVTWSQGHEKLGNVYGVLDLATWCIFLHAPTRLLTNRHHSPCSWTLFLKSL